MKQLNFFGFVTDEELKVYQKAGRPCPHCGTRIKFYCKNIDNRLVAEGQEILAWMERNKRSDFNPREVWAEDERSLIKITDFQKMHYWKMIERAGHGWWRFTEKGLKFFKGEKKLPKRVWIWNNKVVLEEDIELVGVGNPGDRWQSDLIDYTQDFIPGSADQAKDL